MAVQVQRADSGYRVAGDWDGAEAANAFLAHLSARAFSQATIRAYAFDLVNFARFLAGQGVVLAAVSPVEVFAWVDCRAPAAMADLGRWWCCGPRMPRPPR